MGVGTAHTVVWCTFAGGLGDVVVVLVDLTSSIEGSGNDEGCEYCDDDTTTTTQYAECLIMLYYRCVT